MAHQYLKTAKPGKIEDQQELTEAVASFIQKVRKEGDAAIFELTKKFDGIERKNIKITEEEFYAARREVPLTLKEDMKFGINQIKNFAGPCL